MIQQYFLVLLINILTDVSASKYCSYEINGEPKYFICARNEYCCNFGCCVHLAFQFYQLWYYWLLLIFMFMICSGGSWWYKFCRQNDASNYPSVVPSNFDRPARHSATTSAASSEARRIRAMERSHLDSSSYYLQRIWKANSITPPPNYYTASVVRYHSASELETRRQQQECPYYQLYGPPPSYESIVQMSEAGYGQPSCILMAPPPPPPPAVTTLSPKNHHQYQQQQTNNAQIQIQQQSQNTQALFSDKQRNNLPKSSTAVSAWSSNNKTTNSSLMTDNRLLFNSQQNPMPSTSEQIIITNSVAAPASSLAHLHHNLNFNPLYSTSSRLKADQQQQSDLHHLHLYQKYQYELQPHVAEVDEGDSAIADTEDDTIQNSVTANSNCRNTNSTIVQIKHENNLSLSSSIPSCFTSKMFIPTTESASLLPPAPSVSESTSISLSTTIGESGTTQTQPHQTIEKSISNITTALPVAAVTTTTTPTTSTTASTLHESNNSSIRIMPRVSSLPGTLPGNSHHSLLDILESGTQV